MSQEERLVLLGKLAAKFPRAPGVYLMKDDSGKVIYIGKAKDLRARVCTYFRGGDGRAQITYLVARIATLEKILTESEMQAFILERDLINRYKPKYNIMLKDDKSYLNIRINENDPWPRIELVRKVEQDGALYFGPYTYGYALQSVLDVIKRVVPLRTCTNTVFFNRQRPCLEYQIKRCAGPCCLPVERSQYMEWLKTAISILKGKSQSTIQNLRERMEKASEELRFEEAAVMRDRIAVLEEFAARERAPAHRGEARDVFSFYREDSDLTVCVIHVRNGRISDSTSFNLSNVNISDDEVLESALSQFYERDREIPGEIVLPLKLQNESILREALKTKAGTAIEFTVPKQGSKLRALEMARINAEQYFVSSFDEERKYADVSKELALKFKLRQIPRRIECVDISNFQASDIVGGLVSFFDGMPDKQHYRRYNIKNQGKPDDFNSIAELVERRLQSGFREGDLPDLLIIDGGEGQLSKAVEVRDALRIELDIIALAKSKTESDVSSLEIRSKPERVYLPFESEPIKLESNSKVTHFLQRVRDEVHRFAITFHRKKRGKRVFRSVLDEIPGVGPERKLRLLKAYGSVKNMARVPANELARAGRIPLSLAKKILNQIIS